MLPRSADVLRAFGRIFSYGLILAMANVGLPAASALPAPETPPPATARGDWPWWRGPNLDGCTSDRPVATTWSTGENVVWKTPVPGRGHSSPIVYGERLFLTTADEATQRQLVLAFARQSGKPLWSTLAHKGGFPRKNAKNSHASATPACDGHHVFSVFINHDALHVTATNLDGKIVWQTRAGDFASEHGYGSSPVLYRSMVIVNGDSLQGSFIAALDVGAGKVVWRRERKTTGRHGSYATPMVAMLAGKPQLLLTGMGEVSSYDPSTGKLLWSCDGPAEVTACTPACSDQIVFATGGFPEKELLAIRADGHGDVTRSHVLWRCNKGVAYVPSPVYHDRLLYVVADNGIVTCFQGDSGKPLWEHRLPGSFTSSPVLGGTLLIVANEVGKVFVLKTGPEFGLVATNDLGDGVLATPALCGGQIYLRSEHHLWCIGETTRANKLSAPDPKPAS